ncbi:MAG: DNA methyltransferase [Bacteroidota bacterium]
MAESRAPSRAAVVAPAAVAAPPRPRRKPQNTLNDLEGRDWIKFTKSWLICDSRRYVRNKDTELHPARYPEELVSEFVSFFTKQGEMVLDPFCGSGATLVSCHELGRRGIGVELSPRYHEVARQRLANLQADECVMLRGDATRLAEAGLWEGVALPEGPSSSRPDLADDPTHGDGGPAEARPLQTAGDGCLPQFDFIMTSPPYFNMLRKSRGGVESVQKKRAKAGLDTHYSNDLHDLGNIDDYDDYIEALGRVFDQAALLLRPLRYLVVVIQNLRDTNGEVRPLAWDLQRRISQTLSFQGERIWCQNSKPLGIWGYPKVFVPNYHHHYCLIFRKK